ncbi:hypothetical protein NST07_02525 [Paenibacillus sp. FSL L8-0340]
MQTESVSRFRQKKRLRRPKGRNPFLTLQKAESFSARNIFLS